MKLKKCYVSSFGKLKNYTYNFNDGINTIKEEIPWVLCAHGIFMFIANYRCEAKEYQAISPITHERSYMP